MAYLQARSGIARSGVTYSGFVPPNMTLLINGVDRTSNVLWQEFGITDRLGAPSTCTFTLRDLIPPTGQKVEVRYADPNELLFGGHILQAQGEPVDATQSLWHCLAVGYQWLLTHTPVFKSWNATGLNTVVAQLLSEFTDGDFRVGYCPIETPITIHFNFETIPQCLDRLAAIAGNGAWWECTPDKIVNLCSLYPDAMIPLGNGFNRMALSYKEDLSQVRTFVKVLGRTARVTVPAAAGATSLTVDDMSPFDISQVVPFAPGAATVTNRVSSGGGWLGQINFSWNGRSGPAGPGAIDVNALPEALLEGDTIAVVFGWEDATAESDLATLLGSPSTGVVIHRIEDSSLDLAACKSLATATVETFKTMLTEVTFTKRQRHIRIGRLIDGQMTTPFTVSGSYLVRQVQTAPLNTKEELSKAMEAGLYFRNFGDLIIQLR